ncbi:CHAP domain-containing protein [Flavobacterium branchiarum]|uniref:CHAP domain-containing protein n=1 Tax=Flavobacterium branchiarum TaxID=1114870 RepID=A0ABV5FSL4_9FLAO|nr:CHAP domain-containing protein [Flavobacterium branchiarum]MDN3671503.1 CHAP domain-containing protein [Flavobacterium branchiarum]MDN3672620.1 CHAP domain-containing protein [Flavobacterium branchiarum]MDN3675736.1 CHAP domain-containing protein [Flavobacterium branchiarum]
MSTLGQKTLAVSITQLGVEEIPKNSNAGPAVEKYLKSVGLGKGYAWCMAFVYWCTKEASIQLGITNPLAKTAGVLAMLNFKKELVVKEPQPGDIFIMDFGKGQGHTGLVEKVEKNIIHTIEGNTNDDGSREGYKVCRRKRNKSTIKAYLRV